MPHNLQGGKWYSATGDGKVSTISRDDCALAIAAALASGTSESATYTLTGAQSLNNRQIAAIVSQVAGKPLEVIDVNDEQLGQGMRGVSLPGFVADMLVSADANTRAKQVRHRHRRLHQADRQTAATAEGFLRGAQGGPDRLRLCRPLSLSLHSCACCRDAALPQLGSSQSTERDALIRPPARRPGKSAAPFPPCRVPAHRRSARDRSKPRQGRERASPALAGFPLSNRGKH